MSMSTPLEPEPDGESDQGGVVPQDDVLGGTRADAAPADETVPEDDRDVDGGGTDDDAEERSEAADADGPQGYRAPRAGDGLTAAELRSDLGD